MSCKDCEEIQDEALNKNLPDTVPVIYYRVENANVGILACRKHGKIMIERLNEK